MHRKRNLVALAESGLERFAKLRQTTHSTWRHNKLKTRATGKIPLAGFPEVHKRLHMTTISESSGRLGTIKPGRRLENPISLCRHSTWESE